MRTRGLGVALLAFSTAISALAGCARTDSGSAAASDSSATSPTPPADTLPPILVLAASDLQQALPEIVELFQAKTGYRVEVSFGSTGNLETQIENGAPADLFLAASETFVDRLEEAGHVRAGTRRVYAQGTLAVTWREGVPPIDSIQNLQDPVYKTIAIANPEHAPYGTLAEHTLTVTELIEKVRPRLVFGENVSQTLQMVETGNADAGIVALASVFGRSTRFKPLNWNHPAKEVSGGFVPLYRPLRQTGTVLASARRPEDAKALLDFLGSRDGWAVLASHGFTRPPDVTVDVNGNFVPMPSQP